MKKKLFWLTVMLLTVVLFAVSCGGEEATTTAAATSADGSTAASTTASTTDAGSDSIVTSAATTAPKTTETTPITTQPVPIHVFMTDNKSDFDVVYPLSDISVPEIKEAVEYLQGLCDENAAAPFDFKSDYLESGKTAADYDDAKEILLGATNRTQSLAVLKHLRSDDYVICIEDGKLVIAGGSDAATANAIKRFANLFFSQTQNALILEETFRYEKNGSYPVSSMTLCGTPICEYSILSETAYKQDALFVQSELLRLTGYTLPIVDKNTSATHLIAFGTSAEAGAFAKLEQGKLTLSGDTAVNRSVAAARFLNALSGEVALDESFAVEKAVGKTNEIRIFDLNVYSAGYAENSVNNRYGRLYKMIGEQKPTILCLQDVSPTWLTNMKNGYGETPALVASYAFVGTGRNNDEDSVMHPIFYDEALYTLKDSGTFWLSETPEWESVGWDGRSRCICTFAILTEKASGKDFVVMNTKLDSYGTKARTQGMKLIVQRAEAFGLPVILAGDLVNLPSSASTKVATEYAFVNTEKVAATTGTVGKTFNGAFGTETKRVKEATDYVLASVGDFTVEFYTVITDLVDGGYVSNHFPILTKLSLAN